MSQTRVNGTTLNGWLCAGQLGLHVPGLSQQLVHILDQQNTHIECRSMRALFELARVLIHGEWHKVAHSVVRVLDTRQSTRHDLKLDKLMDELMMCSFAVARLTVSVAQHAILDPLLKCILEILVSRCQGSDSKQIQAEDLWGACSDSPIRPSLQSTAELLVSQLNDSTRTETQTWQQLCYQLQAMVMLIDSTFASPDFPPESLDCDGGFGDYLIPFLTLLNPVLLHALEVTIRPPSKVSDEMDQVCASICVGGSVSAAATEKIEAEDFALRVTCFDLVRGASDCFVTCDRFLNFVRPLNPFMSAEVRPQSVFDLVTVDEDTSCIQLGVLWRSSCVVEVLRQLIDVNMSALEEVARSGGLQGALSLVVAHYFSGGQPILDSFEKLVVDIGKLIPELPELKVQLPTRQDGHARAPSPPSRASPPRLRAPPPPASR